MHHGLRRPTGGLCIELRIPLHNPIDDGVRKGFSSRAGASFDDCVPFLVDSIVHILAAYSSVLSTNLIGYNFASLIHVCDVYARERSPLYPLNNALGPG